MSTNPKQNPGPYPEVNVTSGIMGKVPGFVMRTPPTHKNRPPNPIFLTYKDRFVHAAQMASFVDPDLEFVVNVNMPTSNGDPTYYTGYKNSRGGKHGAGKITYISGNEYQGQFHNGLKHGKGQFIYASNQSVYKGQWKDDLKHGQGIQTWTTGAKYEGKFHQNKKHGQATYTMANGDTDTGPWDNDTRHGEFILMKSGKRVKYQYDHNKWVREIPL